LKLTLDGWHCQQFAKCEFTRAVNDGNLTAMIDAWLDVNGFFIPEFSYSVGAGQAAGNHPAGWDVESGDDGDGTDIIHEIDVTDDVHSLHVLDNSRTKQCKISYALPVAIAHGKVLRITYKDASATSDVSANCFLALQLNEGSSVGAHLLIAAGGQVYHKESDADQTTVTGATDTSENLTPGEVRYLWVHLIDKDTYKIKVTTDKTAPSSWSATLTMPDDIDVGWDTIRIYTPDANDDGGVLTDTIDEDFESYTVGNSIIGGQWSWVVGPAGTSTMKCAAGKVGQLVANTGRSQVLYTFPTASANTPAAGVYVEVTVVGPQSGASNGIDVFIKQNATGPVYGLVFQTDGKIYDRDSGGTLNDTGATWSGGTTYVVKFEVVDDTHHKIWINSVDKGSFTNWASTNGKVIDGLALDTYDYATAGNYATTVDIDDITASWTTETVYTTKDIEAYIYELWSDQGFYTPSNIRGAQIDLWQGDKHAWRGFVHAVERIISAGTSFRAALKCYDEFYACGQEDIAVSNLKHTTTIETVNTNEINLVDAVSDVSLFNGLWALVRHNPGQLNYNADSGTYESLEATADSPGSTNPDNIEVDENGTFAKTSARDNDYHKLSIDFSADCEKRDYAYMDYTMKIANPGGQTIQSGRVVIQGKSSWIQGIGGYQYAYVYAKNQVSGDYENVGMVGQAPGANFGYIVEIPFTNTEFPLNAAHFTEDGADWRADLRFLVTFNNANVSVTCDWYIDYLRVHVTASKDVTYVPIEAAVDTIDDTTTIDINAIPTASQNADIGDSVMIAKSIPAAIIASLIMLSNVTVNVGQPFGCHPIDYRGDDGYSAFARTCRSCGIDFWLDVDEDGGNSVLHCGGNKEFWDCHNIASSTEMDDVPGWGVYAVEDRRVTVERTNQVGSYMRIPFYAHPVNGEQHADEVYKLLSASLNDAPGRTLKSIELYFSFRGTQPLDVAPQYQRILYITFSDTNDPSAGTHVGDYNEKPFIVLNYFKAAGVYKWQFDLGDGAGHGGDMTAIETDAAGTIGVRVNFDYDANTIRAYYRDVVVDGGVRKLADTWSPLSNQDDCVLNDNTPRSIGFVDESGGGVAEWTDNYICVHQIHIEFEPEVFDGGSITPRGDVSIETREDQVKSLTVIGGKDEDGTELVHSVDVDNTGYNKVELQTSMTSIAELKRFADSYVDNYESEKYCIRMKGYVVEDSEDFVFHPGWTYTFTLAGVSYTEQLRRATCRADAELPGAVTWDLEFGKAHTSGAERLRAAGQRTTSDIKEIKRKF
jgi:hypothetical protein